MIFTTINGKPLAKVTHDELIDVFVDDAFFKFMDGGRGGLSSSASDFIGTASKWIHVRTPNSLAMNSMIYDEIADLVKRLLIDGFIKAGTAGMRDGLRSAYLVILDSLCPR